MIQTTEKEPVAAKTVENQKIFFDQKWEMGARYGQLAMFDELKFNREKEMAV